MNKRILRQGAVLLLAALLALLLPGCQKEESKHSQGVTYDEEKLAEYISPFSYTGLTVELADTNALKSESVWSLILSRVKILSYPDDAVAYYAEQRRDTYRYYAEKNDWSYEKTLEFFKVSEETILAEAREIVKGDLAFRYIVKDASISLSEEEKAAQLDRYAQKFAEDYGYTKEYVLEHQKELIYDAMLYDKTMEYLIVNNTFLQSNS